MAGGSVAVLRNSAFTLEVSVEDRRVRILLSDRTTGFAFSDRPYLYRAEDRWEEGRRVFEGLRAPTVKADGDAVEVRGALAGLEVSHLLRLPAGNRWLEERVSVRNPGTAPVELDRFETGMMKRMADLLGAVAQELAGDRIVAIPLRHRPTDPKGLDLDFAIADLLRLSGREHRVIRQPLAWQQYGYAPSREWASEGWAWSHGGRTLGVYKFNQEGMEFSLIAAEPLEDEPPEGGRFDRELALRFGGAGMHAGDPSSLRVVLPGQAVELGVTRYEILDGDATRAFYGFRRMLDEHGCRFPQDFDPPVHWNELYDNAEWNLGSPGKPPGRRMTRPLTYTRTLLEAEAEKAARYSCQSLYLDPGWDTDFGTLLWGEQWLGPRWSFVDHIRTRYGLGVSLHCPLATWMSTDGRGVPSWPRESFRTRASGELVEGGVCLASRQYLAEAERRLLEHCADGVAFLMFDGNWWDGGCWNPEHGHPVPLSKEDHVRANLDLARRIHARYPKVLIEMHDMIVGGATPRYTPVYYAYGLPGSYDDNWGFELMWQPMEDIIAGRARSLYWYNLGCNVPMYLHIDLRDDNERCLVFWWYASTCRHLGIGGTHPVPEIAEAQVRAMKRYRQLDRFYKRGDFFGMHEEAHVHALASENAFVVNLFNLSEESRLIEGSVGVAEMGLAPDRWYVTPKGGGFDPRSGVFRVSRRMPPWSAEVMEVRSIPPGSG